MVLQHTTCFSAEHEERVDYSQIVPTAQLMSILARVDEIGCDIKGEIRDVADKCRAELLSIDPLLEGFNNHFREHMKQLVTKNPDLLGSEVYSMEGSLQTFLKKRKSEAEKLRERAVAPLVAERKILTEESTGILITNSKYARQLTYSLFLHYAHDGDASDDLQAAFYSKPAPVRQYDYPPSEFSELVPWVLTKVTGAKSGVACFAELCRRHGADRFLTELCDQRSSQGKDQTKLSFLLTDDEVAQEGVLDWFVRHVGQVNLVFIELRHDLGRPMAINAQSLVRLIQVFGDRLIMTAVVGKNGRNLDYIFNFPFTLPWGEVQAGIHRDKPRGE